MITAAWSDDSHIPSEAELKTAAQLSQEGYLSSVKYMDIYMDNISEITNDNMAQLASIVTDRVVIDNITPLSQLGAILASVQSKVLLLFNMSLSEENTWALVTAMSMVQEVALWENVTLDPELLAAYDGQGTCTRLYVGGDTRARYGARLRRWAGDRGWRVTQDDKECLLIQRQEGTRTSPLKYLINRIFN